MQLEFFLNILVGNFSIGHRHFVGIPTVQNSLRLHEEPCIFVCVLVYTKNWRFQSIYFKKSSLCSTNLEET